MGLGHGQSHAWRKSIIRTVSGRLPIDEDFPWMQLQEITDAFMKQKGNLPPERAEQKLLSLIEMCNEKHIGIAACGHALPPHTLKALLDGELNSVVFRQLSSYLYAIIAAYRVNPASTNEAEAESARDLASHGTEHHDYTTIARRFEQIINLQVTTAPAIIVQLQDITTFTSGVSTEFVSALDALRSSCGWLQAYRMCSWLSNGLAINNVPNGRETRERILDGVFPGWRNWVSWQPSMQRLHLWHNTSISNYIPLRGLLALEGPCFIDTRSTTLRKRLSSPQTSFSEMHGDGGWMLRWEGSWIHWDGVDKTRPRHLLERLMLLVDAACNASNFSKELLVRLLCARKPVTDESLQILEKIMSLNDDSITADVRRVVAFTTSPIDMDLDELGVVLVAIDNPNLGVIRNLLVPYIIEQTQYHLPRIGSMIKLQMDYGDPWNGIESQLSILQTMLRGRTWLSSMLDPSLTKFVVALPPAEDVRILKKIRLTAVESGSNTKTIELLDAYWKACLLSSCNIDDPSLDLIRLLVNLWKKGPDQQRCNLAFTILESSTFSPPNTYLLHLIDLSDILVHTLQRLDHGSTQDIFDACIDLATLLASTTGNTVAIWRRPMYHIIQSQELEIFQYAISHLTVQEWFIFLRCLGGIYSDYTLDGLDWAEPKLLQGTLHTWTHQISLHSSTLENLRSSEYSSVVPYFLERRVESATRQYLSDILMTLTNSRGLHYQHLVKSIAGLLLPDCSNAKALERTLRLLSKTTSRGTEVCTRAFQIYQGAPAEHDQFISAGYLRDIRTGLSFVDISALKEAMGLCGVTLDLEGSESETLDSAADSIDEQILELCAEVRRLDSLRSTVQAIDPDRVMSLLKRLQLTASSPLDDSIARLPQALADVIDKVGENEIEIQFPLTNLTALQRIAIGAGTSQSYVVRLMLGFGGLPPGFCVHFSDESHEAQHNHTPWLVFEGSREPSSQYCHNRFTRGTFQLSRELWRHLQKTPLSIETIYAAITNSISTMTRTCIVCGIDLGAKLICATPCTSDSCITTFSKACEDMRLADLIQDPSVLDLLLTAVHAAYTTNPSHFQTNYPNELAHQLSQLFNSIPKQINTKKQLEIFTPRSLTFSSTTNQSHATLLTYILHHFSGFLVTATSSSSLKIPNLPGISQFLLANTSPSLETNFLTELRKADSTSKILFHGTSLSRLYPILTSGLKILSGTSLQLHGAALGSGIYLAEEPRTALLYAASYTPDPSWTCSFQNFKLLLACELAGDNVAVRDGIHVIQEPERLVLRYLFLIPSTATVPIAGHVVPAILSVCRGLRGGAL